MTIQDQITTVLAEHYETELTPLGLICTCTHELGDTSGDPDSRIREHVASKIAEVVAGAWDQGYKDCLDFHTSDGMEGADINPYNGRTA